MKKRLLYVSLTLLIFLAMSTAQARPSNGEFCSAFYELGGVASLNSTGLTVEDVHKFCADPEGYPEFLIQVLKKVDKVGTFLFSSSIVNDEIGIEKAIRMHTILSTDASQDFKSALYYAKLSSDQQVSCAVTKFRQVIGTFGQALKACGVTKAI